MSAEQTGISPGPPTRNEQIDFSFYLTAFSRYKWLILLLTLCATLAAFIYVSVTPRVYKADALIQV